MTPESSLSDLSNASCGLAWGELQVDPGTRVLMTTDAVGGIWNYTLELSGWLVARGVNLLVATMGPLPQPEQATLLRERGAHLVTSEYRLEWMEQPWKDVSLAGEWLLQLERDFCPNIIHLNGYAHANLPFSASVVLTAHSSIGTWWNAVHGEELPRRYQRYVACLRSAFAVADHIVAPSRAMMRALLSCELRDRYQRDLVRTHQLWAKTTIIPNGSPPPTSRKLSKEPFVLSAGRLWDRAKNVALLESIAGELSWPVRVAGQLGFDGLKPDEEPPHLEYVGNLSPDDIHELMDRASIYVAPAFYEPFGLAILEAAQRGCALVLADIDSLREIWGEAALFVSPHDPRTWVSAIQSLVFDPERRTELGRAAASAARSMTTERMGSGYSHVYRNVLGRNHGRATTADLLT